MIGFQTGHIYNFMDKYCVCIFMDFQTMEAKFKIFKTYDEAQEFCRGANT